MDAGAGPKPEHNLRILFVPISSQKGAGEYYRTLAIARNCQRERPDWNLHCCINHAVEVERADGVHYHELEASPKRDEGKVRDIIRELRPQVVVLDSVVRLPLLEEASATGARIVYVSSRPRRRRVGFLLRNMRLIDEHWIVCAPEQQHLTLRERLLLWHPQAPRVRFMTALTTEAKHERREAFLGKQGFREEHYVLFCSGGGGTRVDGQPAAEIFRDAARRFHQETGFPTVFIAGPLSDISLESTPGRLELPAAPSRSFIDLLAGATLVVSGGGSILQQALVLHTPCLAANAGASDQPRRISDYARKGLIASSGTTVEALATGARELLADEAARADLSGKSREAGFSNAAPRAVQHLEALGNF